MNRIAGVRVWMIGLALLLLPCCVFAQQESRWGIRTNGLLWLTGSPNVGMEYAFTPRVSVAADVSYNPFTYGSEHKIKHLLGIAEYRYWLSEAYRGHFFGVHLQGGVFNIGRLPLSNALKEHRYEGSFYGAGFTYGYHWKVASRFNVGAEIGVGYLRLAYSEFQCGVCAKKTDEFRTNYLGPTRLAVSLVYLIK